MKGAWTGTGVLHSAALAVGFKVLALLLCVCMAVLLAVMLVYQAALDARARKNASLRRNIRETVGRMVAGRDTVAVAEADGKVLFTPKGLAELLRLAEEMSEEGRGALQKILHEMRYESFVSRQLEARDTGYLSRVVRMAAVLGLRGLDGRISDVLYAWPGDVSLQYEGLMALSRLGSTEALVHACMDKDLPKTLSFRSLQQVLGAYTGDRAQLYAYLLHAPDAYVRRACLKLIGALHMRELAGQVWEQLKEPGDDNLLMDAIRCLGELGCSPAAAQIAGFAGHPRWEVRAVVATALGKTDPAAVIEVLVRLLCDPEWQVRYNAGDALRQAGLLAQAAPLVEASGDAFAADILRYMAQIGEIGGAAQ